MRRASSSGEMASPAETNGGRPSVSASPRGPEDSGSLCSSSLTISMSAISYSSSWQISSSRWASSSSMQQTSSSSIRQSLMRFSNFMMDLSTVLREVCKVLNLCSISLRDGAFNTASNSSRSLVHLLRHFRREEVDLLGFLSLCLLFSLMTWSITSLNWRPQAVPGARK